MPAKHNFYLKVLPASQRKDIADASSVEGIDDEIVLLRITIKAMLEEQPPNITEILQTTAMLGKLIKIRYSLSGNYKKSLEDALASLKEDYIIPLGISSLPPDPPNPSSV